MILRSIKIQNFLIILLTEVIRYKYTHIKMYAFIYAIYYAFFLLLLLFSAFCFVQLISCTFNKCQIAIHHTWWDLAPVKIILSIPMGFFSLRQMLRLFWIFLLFLLSCAYKKHRNYLIDRKTTNQDLIENIRLIGYCLRCQLK